MTCPQLCTWHLHSDVTHAWISTLAWTYAGPSHMSNPSHIFYGPNNGGTPQGTPPAMTLQSPGIGAWLAGVEGASDPSQPSISSGPLKGMKSCKYFPMTLRVLTCNHKTTLKSTSMGLQQDMTVVSKKDMGITPWFPCCNSTVGPYDSGPTATYSRQQNCLDVWEFWIVH